MNKFACSFFSFAIISFVAFPALANERFASSVEVGDVQQEVFGRSNEAMTAIGSSFNGDIQDFRAAVRIEGDVEHRIDGNYNASTLAVGSAVTAEHAMPIEAERFDATVETRDILQTVWGDGNTVTTGVGAMIMETGDRETESFYSRVDAERITHRVEGDYNTSRLLIGSKAAQR